MEAAATLVVALVAFFATVFFFAAVFLGGMIYLMDVCVGRRLTTVDEGQGG